MLGSTTENATPLRPHRGLNGLVFLFVLLAFLPAAVPAGAVTIELKDVAPDRIERQRLHALGRLPLPGTPNLAQVPERLAAAGLKAGDPIFIRLFKSEAELELWMRRGTEYVLFATYPVCHWAGTLGPKQREGDKQNPEGFYSVSPAQMHHMGRWPRSLNIGYPNAFDKSLDRDGSYILIHGGCSSIGCFAMTNAVMDEIYGLMQAAVRVGQRSFDVHIFPFRMTDYNLAAHADSPWYAFWRNLKEGYDAFDRTHEPPKVGVCEKRYLVEDVAPGEGAETGPLAVCGESLAAIAAYESRHAAPRTSRSASLLPSGRPSLSQPSPAGRLAKLSLSLWYRRMQLGAIPSPAPAGLPPAEGEATPPQKAGSPTPPRSAPSRTTSPPALAAAEPPPCNPSLASCRRHLQLQTSKARAKRQVAAATGRGHRVTTH